MKKEDLLNNDLLDDDDIADVKKVLSVYDKAQKWLWYVAVAKYTAMMTVGLLLIWGGYVFVSGMKDMVTDAVVTEVKEVAAEKTAEVKAAAKEHVTAVKEKAKGHTIADLGAGFAKLKIGFQNKVNEAADGALIEEGYSPDAPNGCAVNGYSKSECLEYSSAEINGSDYNWVKLWKGTCDSAHEEAMKRLKKNGKITENDYRVLLIDCQSNISYRASRERDATKAKMLEDAGL